MIRAIYKILRPEEWDRFQSAGLFGGSPDDLKDGFLHLSFEDQVRGTVGKHFVDETELVLLRLDSAKLESALRLEVSRDGQEFPHLYRALHRDDVIGVESWPEFCSRHQ
jgi:uncharacterized protein (DUF952 family)